MDEMGARIKFNLEKQNGLCIRLAVASSVYIHTYIHTYIHLLVVLHVNVLYHQSYDVISTQRIFHITVAFILLSLLTIIPQRHQYLHTFNIDTTATICCHATYREQLTIFFRIVSLLDKKLLTTVLSFLGKSSSAYYSCKYWRACLDDLSQGAEEE